MVEKTLVGCQAIPDKASHPNFSFSTHLNLQRDRGVTKTRHFRGHLHAHSLVHFRDNFRESSWVKFAVRVLCASLSSAKFVNLSFLISKDSEFSSLFSAITLFLVLSDKCAENTAITADQSVTDLGFCGPRIPSCATAALWGRVTPFLELFSKYLSSVLWRTELCHEVRSSGPEKPRISRSENHHLAVFVGCCTLASSVHQGLKNGSFSERPFSRRRLSGPIRAILRRYRSDTPHRAILFQGGLHSLKMVRYAPWYLVSHGHICATPFSATYRAVIVR